MQSETISDDKIAGRIASQRGRRNGLAAVYFYGLLLICATAIIAAPHAPLLQDYPTWVYEGTILSLAVQGHSLAGFAVKSFPVPNMLSDLPLALLTIAVGWYWAAKVWLVAYLSFSAYSVRRAAGAFPNQKTLLYWLAPAFSIAGLAFWYGFLNFEFGLMCLLLVCAELARTPRRGRLALLLALTFMSHAIPFLTASLLVFGFATHHRRWRLLVAFVPSALLGAWYVYGRFVLTGNPENAILNDVPVAFASTAFVIYKVNTFFKSLGYVNPIIGGKQVMTAFFTRWGTLLLISTNICAGTMLLSMSLRDSVRSFRLNTPERLIWGMVAGLSVVAMLAPSAILGISDPGARVFSCALILLMLVLGGANIMTRVLCGACALLGAASVCLFIAVSFSASIAGLESQKNNSLMPSERWSMPLAKFAHVEPEARARYYDDLKDHHWSEPVFQTSMLLNRSQSSRKAACVASKPGC